MASPYTVSACSEICDKPILAMMRIFDCVIGNEAFVHLSLNTQKPRTISTQLFDNYPLCERGVMITGKIACWKQP